MIAPLVGTHHHHHYHHQFGVFFPLCGFFVAVYDASPLYKAIMYANPLYWSFSAAIRVVLEDHVFEARCPVRGFFDDLPMVTATRRTKLKFRLLSPSCYGCTNMATTTTTTTTTTCVLTVPGQGRSAQAGPVHCLERRGSGARRDALPR